MYQYFLANFLAQMEATQAMQLKLLITLQASKTKDIILLQQTILGAGVVFHKVFMMRLKMLEISCLLQLLEMQIQTP